MTGRTANGARPAWALGLTSVAFFMVALDALVVVTALPAIHRELGGQLSTLEWTVNAYLLVFAATIITAATAGERFGRRHVYSAGLALFSLASAACALAPNASVLIAARAVQGLGAAVVTPLSLTILTSAFPASRRGQVIGIWGGIAGLAVAAGPVIGGAVTEGLSWHWIFWVNVPIGIVAALLSARMLPDAPRRRARPDLGGAALVTAGAGSLVWGLVQAGQDGWQSAPVAGALAAGAVLVAVFAFWERSVSAPMLPLELFRSRTFTAANLTAVLMNAAIFSAAFLMSQYFQLSLGYGPLSTGLRFLPWTATPLVVAPLAGALSDKLGPRRLMALGLFMQAGGLAWIAAVARGGPGGGYARLVGPLVIAGVGISMAIPTAPMAVLSSAGPAQMGAASGVLNMLQRLGGVFGVAIVSAVFAANGRLGSALGVLHGFRPALGVASGLSLLATVAALGVRARSQERSQEGAALAAHEPATARAPA
jgi:EmrB/QacA subfamily drug resistance transporter